MWDRSRIHRWRFHRAIEIPIRFHLRWMLSVQQDSWLVVRYHSFRSTERAPASTGPCDTNLPQYYSWLPTAKSSPTSWSIFRTWKRRNAQFECGQTRVEAIYSRFQQISLLFACQLLFLAFPAIRPHQMIVIGQRGLHIQCRQRFEILFREFQCFTLWFHHCEVRENDVIETRLICLILR